MATFLDIGLMSYASKIFTFILVFSIMFGLLRHKKVLGEKSTGLQGLISFVFAAMAILSPASTAFINFITPWFFVLILIAFLILMVLFMFGETEEHVAKVVRERELFWYIFIFIIIIVLFGLGSVFGQGLLSKGDSKTTTQPLAETQSALIQADDDLGTADTTTTAAGTSVATSSYEQNVVATLFHPRILGLMLVFIIGIFAMLFLTRPFDK